MGVKVALGLGVDVGLGDAVAVGVRVGKLSPVDWAATAGMGCETEAKRPMLTRITNMSEAIKCICLRCIGVNYL